MARLQFLMLASYPRLSGQGGSRDWVTYDRTWAGMNWDTRDAAR